MLENEVSEQVIGAAIEVHRILGPGLLETVYEEAICHELELRGLAFRRQVAVPLRYKEVDLGSPLRLDLIVEGMLIVEIKSVETVPSVFAAQLLSYLRLTGICLGLLINFNTPKLVDGIKRIANRLQ